MGQAVQVVPERSAQLQNQKTHPGKGTEDKAGAGTESQQRIDLSDLELF